MDKNLLNQAETLVEVLLENAYQEYFKTANMVNNYTSLTPEDYAKRTAISAASTGEAVLGVQVV